MQLQITGNIDITPAIKEHAQKKLAQLAKRSSHISGIHMVLHVEHHSHIAEASVRINGSDIHASAKENDMYAAIDALVEKLTQQVAKHKDKMTDSHHKG